MKGRTAFVRLSAYRPSDQPELTALNLTLIQLLPLNAGVSATKPPVTHSDAQALYLML
jgi:hypothetical protein